MERPRLRSLDAFPVATKEGHFLALRDPSGMTEAVAFLPPVAFAIVQLFDGVRDRRDIQLAFLQRYGQLLPLSLLDELIRQLDDGLLLDSERFAAHAAEIRAAFEALPVRAAAHAGRSYPGEPNQLREFLGGHFGPPDGVVPPQAVIAPHIDLHRGARAYGLTYPTLAHSDADLFVVFGTDHVGAYHPFTLTRKHYDTPLGRVETDLGLTDVLAAKLGSDELFADELHHRSEHSIEFQALLLRYVLPPDREITILPVLCGSLHRALEAGRDPSSEPLVARFLDLLSEQTAGRRVCFIAGADLAHVGPRFGDARPLGKSERERLAEADAVSLNACARGDAAAFWDSVRSDGDARRICGLAPIYHTLKLARAQRGQVLVYDQCAADDEGGSLVSIGGVVLQ